MAELLAIKDLAMNRNYIRRDGPLDQKGGQVDQMADHMRAVGKAWPEDWSPIIVRPIDDIQGYHYEVIDGANRILASLKVGLKTVPADIRKLSNEDADVLQFTANVGHGTDLKRNDRNKWVVYLINTYKWTQAEVAKRVQLTQASVSRILADKQEGEGRKKVESSRKAKRDAGDKRRARKTTEQPWPVLLFHTIKEYEDHRQTAEKFLGKLPADRRNKLAGRFYAMVDALAQVKGFGRGEA